MSRILLVEDEPVNIQAVSGVLKEQGYQVSVATSGAKALDVLTRLRPDLILLDVMMPGLDGFETCRRIKANPELREIPIIFLTAKSETDDIVQGFELGAVDYVSKPFSGHELLARARTHLALDRLHKENRQLLLNVLPEAIAEKLKAQPGILAERFEDVSVLFTDIVGFTPLSARLSPTELLELLNHIFSAFDELAASQGLEKIKTIGDAYMVAGGLPEPHPDHLACMAWLSLQMHQVVREAYQGLSLRVGLHVGSVIAGVIGRRKFIYDVWGETVNTASRLESHGAPERVHVSRAVQQRLADRFEFEPRGVIELKGKGPCETFFLVSAKG
ncbi:MAG: adenylate/guanylate cyclase domain-containing protein [Vulcanimicrobiota bacterium]